MENYHKKYVQLISIVQQRRLSNAIIKILKIQINYSDKRIE